MDMTTGKITTQSNALKTLANAQLLVAKVQAQTRAADARRQIVDLQTPQFQFGGGLGLLNREGAQAVPGIASSSSGISLSCSPRKPPLCRAQSRA